MPARGERILLTERQERIAREALGAGLNVSQAAWLAGVPYRRLQMRLEDQLRDARVGRGRGRKGRRNEPDPTEDEIERAKAMIRARNGHELPVETSPAGG